MKVCKATCCKLIANVSTTSLIATESIWLLVKEMFIDKNSDVNANDIGEYNNNSLLCLTNNYYCCDENNDILGNWYFPYGSKLGNYKISVDNNGFYQSRDEMLVRLIRKGSSEERGSFRCEIPDGSNKTHKNICKYW